MNENTNDVSMNGENDEQELERLRSEVEAEIEQDIAAMPPDDTPLPEAPPEKKQKKRDRELPDWMLDKTTVNELIFSRMFLGQHPMKCIKGVFYDYDGVVDENELGNEIYG